jgi:hypothetical protein
MVKQYDIIGFSKYTISSNCILTQKKNGRGILSITRPSSNARYFQIIHDSNKRCAISEARLLYCAIKGIDPLEIGRNYRFFFTNEEKKIENIVIKEPWEFSASVWDIRKKYLLDKTTFYEQTVAFAIAVLSDNTEEIYREINRHDKELKRVIRRFVVNEQRVTRIYLKVVNDVVIGVKNGVCFPAHPLPYLITYIRRLVANNRFKNQIE